jgi:hypothetical protein
LKARQQLLYAPDPPDQLHLAFNTSSPEPADALTEQLLLLCEQPAQLQACLAQLDHKEALQLLSTALLRRHFDAAASFEGLLHTFRKDWSFVETVTAALGVAVKTQDGDAVASLCKLQSSQQLAPTAVAGMLLQAMQQDDSAAVVQLLELPAAQQLPVSSAVQLLQAALQQGYVSVVTFVCQQEAAQAIDAADITTLLLTAVEEQQLDGLGELLELPAAEMQHAAAAQQLLLAAMDAAAASGDVEAFQMLHEELPAVGELSAAQMVVLLQSAISQDEALSAFLVLQLLLLQGSQAVSSSCIKQLLTQAVQLRRVGAAQLLCKCQGAQGISKHSCKQLVALARNQGILHKVALLLLSLLDEVDAWLHFQAVAAAVAAGDAKAVVALAGLPPESVGGRVLWPQVQAWLADAVSEHQREMVAAMCKLQVRQPRNCPDSKGVATLLQCAAQDTHDEALRILVQEVLDSGNICSAQQAAEAVAQQMQAALKQGDVQLLRCLAGWQ